MKYIEATQFGGPEVLHLIEATTPEPSEGTLLIETEAAGVNYLDITMRAGFYGDNPTAPLTPGLEVVGTVKSVGQGVTEFKEGDRVAAMTIGGGGYTSHIVVPAASAIPIPSQMDAGMATALLVQGITAHLLLEEAKVKAGDFVLISAAAGGVGSLAVQIAKSKGATVLALASADKHDSVKALGAEHVFDYNTPGWSKPVSEIVGSHGVQAYIDSIGDLASEALPLLGHAAHWLIFGVRSTQGHALGAEHLWPMIEKNITLRGFNLEGSFEHVPRALADLFQWVSDGTLKIEVTRYPLAEARKVHEILETRQTTGKIVLVP